MPNAEFNFHHIDAWVERKRVADGTPGLSLAITDRERILHTATFGLEDVAAKRPVAASTLFETGSIGKSFTAIALLQLREEGKLDVHVPVSEYLPWFEVQTAHEPITLHHLLTHTAGITSGIDFAPAGPIQVWALRETETSTPPGSFFHYSNLGYKVLGLVLERVAGKGYGEVIKERILDPLGLVDSISTLTHADRHRLAVGYSPAFDDRPWWPGRPLAPATWLETDTADGCLAMTAADLAAYTRMLLNRGAYPDGRILSEESFALFSQRAVASGDQTWYGYGVMTSDSDGRSYIGHGGGMVGYFSGMLGGLDSGLGVAVVVNGPGSPNTIARAVLKALESTDKGRPAELPPTSSAIEPDALRTLAGVYRGPADATLTIALRDGGLTIDDGEDRAQLVAAHDQFASEHPRLNRFWISIGRHDGRVTWLDCGPDRWFAEGTAAPAHTSLPKEWSAFPGHYRSHNPWTPDFRVYARDGQLWLEIASEPDGLEAMQPLVLLGDGVFHAGEDERIPERISFDTVIEGQALRARLSFGAYYRVNTP